MATRTGGLGSALFTRAFRLRGGGWGLFPFYAGLVLILLLGASVPSPGAEIKGEPTGEEGAVLTRVRELWEARIQQRYVAEYLLYAPEVRARVPLPEFVRGRRFLQIKEYTIQEVVVKGAEAEVTVGYTYVVQMPPPPPGMELLTKAPVTATRTFTERWVRLEGAWYRTLRQEG